MLRRRFRSASIIFFKFTWVEKVCVYSPACSTMLVSLRRFQHICIVGPSWIFSPSATPRKIAWETFMNSGCQPFCRATCEVWRFSAASHLPNRDKVDPGPPWAFILAENSIHEVSMHEVMSSLVLCFRNVSVTVGAYGGTFSPSRRYGGTGTQVFVFPDPVKVEQAPKTSTTA